MSLKPVSGLISATESAAIAAYKWRGLGNQDAADKAAVDAMRYCLNKINMNATVVIGEGERDNAPMLYIGEKVGKFSRSDNQSDEYFKEKIDIALDPLEGTKILSKDNNNSLSVVAATDQGGFLNAPDIYMDKIAIGLDLTEQIIDLDNTPKENLAALSRAKKCDISDLTAMVLERPRHENLIAKIREAGARVKLIQDGDIAGVIATTKNDDIDIYMGIGGAPEGVLAAAALSALNGQMCTRLIFRDENEKNRAKQYGITDFNKKYYIKDLASGDIVFVATGITNGDLLSGININNHIITTETIVMLSQTKKVQRIYTSQPISNSI